ncbi:MAG TPA: glutamyl-tRNA reductase [Polyangiaceae bacterium]|nr:glutamyl-tRNA reductase [Polyangiaceae bacterium]
MIVVVGVSHQAAPIEVREQLALSRQAAAPFLKGLIAGSVVHEAMVLSTCNRVELIAAGENASKDRLEEVAAACAAELVRQAPEAASYVYRYQGAAAVRHLFRVAASLDSMVLGEPQILGQLKQAFESACKLGTVGSALHRAIPRALRAAKRVRSETTIGSGQVSVPSVAVDLASQIFGELSGKTALLVGSGDMGQTVARLLSQGGAAIQVLGRNAATVAEVARLVGGEPRALSDLKASLTEADVVVTSTSAPNAIITRELVASVRRSRRGRSLFFIDLAVPRDVDARVGELDGVFLYNIDDLSQIVAESLASRQRERDAAELIIADAAEGYERWAEAEQVTPVIKALRSRFSHVMRAELERSLRGRLKDLGPAEREALEKMIDASINKILHDPSSTLRSLANDRTRDADFVESAVDVLTVLFSLDVPAESRSLAPLESAGRQVTAAGPESGSHLASALQEDAAGTSGR